MYFNSLRSFFKVGKKYGCKFNDVVLLVDVLRFPSKGVSEAFGVGCLHFTELHVREEALQLVGNAPLFGLLRILVITESEQRFAQPRRHVITL